MENLANSRTIIDSLAISSLSGFLPSAEANFCYVEEIIHRIVHENPKPEGNPYV